MGHFHTCAAQRGQMVSLSALETAFMGRVMCPTGDREENGECLPSNLQQLKSQILPTITSTL